MIGGTVARHAITVVRAPLVRDSRGNDTRDWDAAAEHESRGWAIDASDGQTEDKTNRDGSAVQYTLRGPLAADIRATDRVRLFGDLHRIQGGVLTQLGPSALTSHKVVRLIAWEG